MGETVTVLVEEIVLVGYHRKRSVRPLLFCLSSFRLHRYVAYRDKFVYLPLKSIH